jgi:hypothetical protein
MYLSRLQGNFAHCLGLIGEALQHRGQNLEARSETR